MLLADPFTISHEIWHTRLSTIPPIRARTMAQALFDEHPLEEYLRGVGETPELMPGGSAELEFELDTTHRVRSEDDYNDLEWRPPLMYKILEALQSAILSAHSSSAQSPFVERFKYDIISSSLLAPTLAASHSGRLSGSPSLPGKLRLDHSRTPSLDATSLPPLTSEPYYWLPSTTFLLVAVLFSAGYTSLAVLTLGGSLTFMHIFMNDTIKHDMTPSLESLYELIASSDVWESVVQEAIAVLEKDERGIYFSPTNPSSPSSSLRISLHSSLHTTQTQCDNIRHLFSALTSPSELSQLSEMYAPSSPLNPSFSLLDVSPRPLSLPASRNYDSPNAGTSLENKRSTWNGSYTSLASSPTIQVLRRREKRRSDISALVDLTSSRASTSAPVTPSPNTLLTQVREEEDDANTEDPEYFGAAALDLQRKRRSGGMETFRIAPPSATSSPRTPPSSTPSSASRFTTIQTPRHPHSLSALRHALQGALASKRYACSHLLALRFADEEDDGYWEDVRSVMGLLTTTFVDASSRLTEALEDVEKQRLRDENPTPKLEQSEGSASPSPGGERQAGRSHREKISFAPMLSHVSRFAAHADAISSALDDAREHLEECVVALKADSSATGDVRRSRSRQLRSLVQGPGGGEDETEVPEALRAYERLRRELGMALRECERGRERLLDILDPPETLDDTDPDNPDDVPALAHDASDESDDRPDPTSPLDDASRAVQFEVPHLDILEGAADDATPHLLLTASSQHLPPAGVDQVYEGESGTGTAFTRERSRMTREERIKMMKARRESGATGLGLGLGLGPVAEDSPSPASSGMERWGPGGEVVQELKDVIWKVGERKRRMTVSQASPQREAAAHQVDTIPEEA